MPTADEIMKILTSLPAEKYRAAVAYISFLAGSDDSVSVRRRKQIEFVLRTAGRIDVDEEAVMNLRMSSII